MRGRLALGTTLLLSVAGGCRSSASEVTHLTRLDDGASPRILCVVAHPDDEIAFAGTLYKTATLLGGACDVLVITNGEGGFKYATLAEPVYGVQLTDEEVGRAHLPAIRRAELVAGCELLGVRDLFWLGQTDHRFTQDVEEVLGADGPWDLERVRAALAGVLARGRYDFVLTLAPTPDTHGHHKAATILLLEAVRELSEGERPVALCARTWTGDEAAPPVTALAGHPVTAIRKTPPLVFDRTQKFGFREQLDYTIVVNWAIAEHKSQGTMQLLTDQGGSEHYFVFHVSPADAAERAAALFEALAAPQYPARTYGAGAGTNATP